MALADDKANTSLLLDAALRAGHIEPTEAGDEYRVTPAGVAWATAIVTGDGRRTWSLRPAPGPEVTAVTCDCHARRWLHYDGGEFWKAAGYPFEVYRWAGLLANHPNLTDATPTTDPTGSQP